MRYLITTVLILAASPLYAEIYKWVDENGQVHFTQQPPADHNAKAIEPKITNQNTTSSKRQREMERWLNAEEAEQNQIKKQQQKQDNKEAKNKQRCNYSREYLRYYQGKSRIFKLDQDGKRQLVSEAERNSAIEKWKSETEKWCD